MRQIRSTESQIKEFYELYKPDDYKVICHSLFGGGWGLTFTYTLLGRSVNQVMCSQRKDRRSFATIGSARNTCLFVESMIVKWKNKIEHSGSDFKI